MRSNRKKIAIECGIVFSETRPFLGRKPLKACLYLLTFQWQRHIPQLKLKKKKFAFKLAFGFNTKVSKGFREKGT